MAKKVTLETLAKQLAEMDARIENGFGSLLGQMDKGFAAVADHIADIRHEVATKDQLG